MAHELALLAGVVNDLLAKAGATASALDVPLVTVSPALPKRNDDAASEDTRPLSDC